MPLKHSKSPQAFKSNVKTEMAHGKPQKQALAIAYSAKRRAKAKGGNVAAKADSSPTGMEGCPDCMDMGGKCMAHGGQAYAEGGEVDAQAPLHTKPTGSNYELEESTATQSMAPHELVDSDLPSSEDSSDEEEDLPKVSESLSLAAEIMKDRKRQKMAKGGTVKSYEDSSESSMVGADHGPTDDEMGMNETHDSDELDAPREDGRDSRGLNAEPVHTMEDDEHDVSDASLVSQILMDRKKRRKGM